MIGGMHDESNKERKRGKCMYTNGLCVISVLILICFVCLYILDFEKRRWDNNKKEFSY